MPDISYNVDVKKVSVSIDMIKRYVDAVDTSGVIAVLEEMIKTPEDDSLKVKLMDSLQPLGIYQGTVLSYAPYVAVLLMNNMDEMGLDD